MGFLEAPAALADHGETVQERILAICNSYKGNPNPVAMKRELDAVIEEQESLLRAVQIQNRVGDLVHRTKGRGFDLFGGGKG